MPPSGNWKPLCFGSPTTYTPTKGSACLTCPSFTACGPQALARARALALQTSMHDVAAALEAAMRAAGVPVPADVPAPTPTPAASLHMTVAPPARGFDRVKRDTLPDEDHWLNTLPVKVAKRLRPMVRNGLTREIAFTLAAGRNPFPTTSNAFLHDAMEVLMGEGRVAKATLRRRFMDRFGWTEGTAFSHVAVATKVFHALNIADDVDNCLILRRKPTATIEA